MKVKVSEHPKYKGYFKLKMTGNKAMVEMKMQQAGVDPKIIDKDLMKWFP